MRQKTASPVRWQRQGALIQIGMIVLSVELNRLLTGIAEACSSLRPREVWLLAPNMRTGNQWLETLARAGIPSFNVRIRGMRSIAFGIADPLLAGRQLRTASFHDRRLLAGNALHEAAPPGREGYLFSLQCSSTLVAMLARSINDLRLAGVAPGNIDPAAFEVPEKGSEIISILTVFERMLTELGMVDYPGALRLAMEMLAAGPAAAIGGDVTILAPAFLVNDLSGLELQFWNSLPPEMTQVIEYDRPAEEFNGPDDGPDRESDLSRLAWINKPQDAPAPKKADGSVNIFRAAAEVNEVREVIRRCARQGIPLDEVEVICTDEQTYIPLICELFSTLFSVPVDDLPVRFASGIPIHYSRPAKALTGWLRWVTDGGIEQLLDSCLPEELLVPGSAPPPGEAPDDGIALLEAARHFLATHARASGRFDEYCMGKLLEEIEAMAESLQIAGEPHWFSSYDALHDLLVSASVAGSRPEAGALFVSGLDTGGHSGRPYTFIVGLDDSRIPPQNTQDPLLLDEERLALAAGMKTGASKVELSLRSFARLLSGLRGSLTLSHISRSLDNDREIFPSQLLLAAFRILHDRQGDFAALASLAGEPASFVPSSGEECLEASEWWASTLCQEPLAPNAREAVESEYPHLSRSREVFEARESDLFTEFDGNLSEVWSKDGFDFLAQRSISPTGLEKMAKCPLEFFIEYVLGVKPPKPADYDIFSWLDHLEVGSLYHSLFCKFMNEKKQAGEKPTLDTDYGRLTEILDEELAGARVDKVPPNEYVFEEIRRRMRAGARTFLAEEERHSREHTPLFIEQPFGDMRAETDGEVTPDSLTIPLGEGLSVSIRGKIDRVDSIDSSGGERLSVWDYKSGRVPSNKRNDKRYKCGKGAQRAIYVRAVEELLKGQGSAASVESFGYFFTDPATYGGRLEWSREEVDEEMGNIARLCKMMASGAFPFSPEPEDDYIETGDYAAAYGDMSRQAANIKRKMGNPANDLLKPFVELRSSKKKGS